MTAELSYMQLKAANEARNAEEVREEQRKRSLLVLILQHLTEEGFLDSVQALAREASSQISKYEVCDNVDLQTILQEYEAYYYMKFKKQPKITKRSKETGSTKHNSRGGISLPQIAGATDKRKSEKRTKRPLSDGRKKEKVNHSTDCSSTGSLKGLEALEHGLELTGSSVGEERKQMKGVSTGAHNVLQRALRDASAAVDSHQEKLLKPIAGFAGYDNEMKELAAVISRDIFLHNPDVHWDDIIGLEDPKRLIKEAVVYPIKYPELFTGILSPWKGLLLYGPPGTGKTLLAKAVATECKTTFFNISASSIVSKWRGDSEKLVRVLFELARFHAPSTIFMDEIDSIMGQRSGGCGASGEHEGSRRMKTELLVQMDGLARTSDLVFLLAASNLPWELDHAMLRRLEKRILVDLPNESAREAMFRHYLRPVISHSPFKIVTEVDYALAAKLTAGYSGSDIRLVSKEAAMALVREVFERLESVLEREGQSGTDGITVKPVLTKDVEAAITRTKPSAKLLVTKYSEWQNKYESV